MPRKPFPYKKIGDPKLGISLQGRYHRKTASESITSWPRTRKPKVPAAAAPTARSRRSARLPMAAADPSSYRLAARSGARAHSTPMRPLLANKTIKTIEQALEDKKSTAIIEILRVIQELAC